jgi:hypothetical protein
MSAGETNVSPPEPLAILINSARAEKLPNKNVKATTLISLFIQSPMNHSAAE